jgi:hypothetical protein
LAASIAAWLSGNLSLVVRMISLLGVQCFGMIEDYIGRLRSHCSVKNYSFFELLKNDPSPTNLGTTRIP